MLVLSRKKNQSIVIGDNIQIEVLKISGNTVRIGIAAPQEVKVLRGELAPFGISDEDSGSEEWLIANSRCRWRTGERLSGGTFLAVGGTGVNR